MTPKNWKPAFLEAYAESGNLKESAESVGVTRQAVYDAKKRSKVFAAEVAVAREHAADELEAVAIKRAKDHSDTLLIFLLKGLKPDTYADKKVHGFDPDQPLKISLKWE